MKLEIDLENIKKQISHLGKPEKIEGVIGKNYKIQEVGEIGFCDRTSKGNFDSSDREIWYVAGVDTVDGMNYLFMAKNRMERTSEKYISC